jgi:hypothetical protein
MWVPFVLSTGFMLKGGILSGRFVFFLVLVFFFAPFVRYFVVNISIIQLAKALIAGDFTIIVFRKFFGDFATQKFDHDHKSKLLPLLGAYGNVVLIHNESLVAAPPGLNADSEEIMSQLRDSITCEGEDEWQPRVLKRLHSADLAVFHWATPPTVNMLWELERAVESLPSSRLLFIESDPSWGLKAFLESRFSNVSMPTAIQIPRAETSSYTEAIHKFMRLL